MEHRRLRRRTEPKQKSKRTHTWQATQIALGRRTQSQTATANDEGRSTYFVTKSGLVAQNTRTAARAAQGEVKTRKEWDKHEILGIVAVGTQVDDVLTTEAVKAKSCRFAGNRHEQRRKEAHKQNPTSKAGDLDHSEDRLGKLARHRIVLQQHQERTWAQLGNTRATTS